MGSKRRHEDLKSSHGYTGEIKPNTLILQRDKKNFFVPFFETMIRRNLWMSPEDSRYVLVLSWCTKANRAEEKDKGVCHPHTVLQNRVWTRRTSYNPLTLRARKTLLLFV